MTADLQTLFPPVTPNPPSPPEAEVFVDNIATTKDEFGKVESYWSVSDDFVVVEEEEILTSKKGFLPTPSDTPPPYPAPALEECEDEDNEIIMQTQEEKDKPLKSADQPISMNLGSTTESTVGSKHVNKYVNTMEQLRDTQ
eukprot:896514-Ditylum_brightwellii.AAC.1